MTSHTKAALLDATVNILSNSDISQLSLRKVAKEVGVTATTIYRHFENKEALLSELQALLKQRLREGLYEGIKNQTLIEKVRLVLKNSFKMFISRRTFLMAAEQFHNLSTYDANKEKIEDSEILERWHNMLKEGIEKGIFQDLPLYQLDIMTIGTARSLVASSSFDKSNFSVDLIINCLIRGISK